MKAVLLRLGLVLAGMLLLTSAWQRIHSASIMAEAAKGLLSSLTPEQRAKAVFRFDDEERYNWHYIPRVRKGLPLKEMTPAQHHLAHALLSAGLSQRGYIKAATIMSLEEVLRILENSTPEHRNPEGYFFSVFGEPGEKSTWGFRVEGHHLSQNFTVVNGKVAGSPSFFGSNPAEVRQGPRAGLRVLAAEEDLGRDLLRSLEPQQKRVAIVEKTAYKDILTTASRKAALDGQPNGLAAAKMSASQRRLLDRLVEEYADDMPAELAQARMEKLKQAGDKVYFAWAGGEQRNQPHYYRVQAPSFLIEYDNTQNEANHIHAVWRDFNGDFGEDLLKEHYQSSHQ
jgi:hypothetical protein